MRIPTKHDVTLKYGRIQAQAAEFVMDNPATFFVKSARTQERFEEDQSALRPEPAERKLPEDLWAQATRHQHGLLEEEKKDLKTSNSFTTGKSTGWTAAMRRTPKGRIPEEAPSTLSNGGWDASAFRFD
jgi:hypothetical protein